MIGPGLKLTMQQRRGVAFTPATLFAGTTPGAWYDPSDLVSMSQNEDGTGPAAVNSPVGRMMDKSGRGNHATQPTPAFRPILRQDATGTYLAFDGADDFMIHPLSLDPLLDASLSCSASRGPGGATQELLTATPPNTAMSAIIGANYADPDWGTFANGAVRSAGASVLGVAKVMTNISTAATQTQTLYTNGAGKVVHAGPFYGGDGLDRRTIGRSAVGFGGLFNGRLYSAIMLQRALTDDDLARVAGYQAGKAGVAL